MIPASNTVYEMLEAIISGCDEDKPLASLPKTRVQSLDTDIDGISGHYGTDGEWYFRLCSGGRAVTPGMNYERYCETLRRVLSYPELCSLSGRDAGKTSVRRTGAFFADVVYFKLKDKCTYGDMGYTLGGDYEASRVDFELEDRDMALEKFRKDTVDFIREYSRDDRPEDPEDELELIWIAKVRERHFDTYFDEDGKNTDEVEVEDDYRTVLNLACCSEETAVRTGLKEYLDKSNADSTVTPYTFIL